MGNRQALLMLLLVSPAVLAETLADPWAQVPALPTSCYSSDDGFQDQAFAAAEALGSEQSKQEETNAAISQQFREMDIMEQQQRMMDFTMEHPEDAR